MDVSRLLASPNVEDRRASEALPNLLLDHALDSMLDRYDLPPAAIVRELNARRPYDPANPFSSGHYQGLPNEPIIPGPGRLVPPQPDKRSIADQMRTQGLYDALSNIIRNGGSVTNFGMLSQ